MDDLYSHLDNYNEEEKIAELQNENKSLKAQLQTYANAVTNLQIEFDKLTSEHKKLETNYSSLLKTARAEIERKTQIIANLNTEKDQLIIQRRQRNAFRYKNLQNDRPPLKKNEEYERFKNHSPLDPPYNMVTEGFREEVNFSPTDDVTDSSKENMLQQKNITQVKPKSVMSRRKSMPAFNMEVDEILREDDVHVRTTKNIDRRTDRSLDRNRQSNKSECSSIDGRHSNYDTRDSRRSRYSRYVDDEIKRTDKYDHKYKKDRSPSRYRRRYEDNSWSDKYRRFESPPLDTYQRYHRSNYERGHIDRFMNRNHEKYSKHKLTDHEQPKSKRMKPDNPQYEEEQWSYERLSDSSDMQHFSCQSPDNNFLVEPNPHHQIREIKLNATTKQEDPRALSNKYVLTTDDGKVTCSTVKGRNVVIVPFKNPPWRETPGSMPDALKQRPPSTERITELFVPSNKSKSKESETETESHIGNLPKQAKERAKTDIQLPDTLKQIPPNTDIAKHVVKKNKAISVDFDTGECKVNNNPKKPKERIKNNNEMPDALKELPSYTVIDKNVGVQKNKAKPKEPCMMESDEDNLSKQLKIGMKTNSQMPDALKISNTEIVKSVMDKNNIAKPKDPGTVEYHDDNVLKQPKEGIKTPTQMPDELKLRPSNSEINKDVIDPSNSANHIESGNVDNLSQRPTIKTYIKLPDVLQQKLNTIMIKDTNVQANLPVPIETDTTKLQLDKPIEELKSNSNQFGIKQDSIITDLNCNKPQSLSINKITKKKSNETDNKEKTTKVKNNKEVKTTKNTQKSKNEIDDKNIDKNRPNSTIDDVPKKSVLPASNFKNDQPKYTSAKELIEGDLELSDDETCDSTDLHNTIKKDKGNVNCNQKSIKSIVQSNALLTTHIPKATDFNIFEDKESPEDIKNTKSKRKNKHKEETKTKAKENPKKKEKAKQVTTKFSELFGDNSTLITPEDLGIVPQGPPQISEQYANFFEDAQDAIGLNMNLESKFNTLPEKPSENVINIDSVTTSLEATEPSELEPNIKPIHDPVQSIYQNLEVGAANIEDAVKTIVISTGVQPDTVTKCENAPTILEVNPPVIPLNLPTIQALATSTPYKTDANTQPDVNPPTVEPSCNSTDSRLDSSANDCSVDINKDTDIPDIRIFVRRRRRPVKKS